MQTALTWKALTGVCVTLAEVSLMYLVDKTYLQVASAKVSYWLLLLRIMTLYSSHKIKHDLKHVLN